MNKPTYITPEGLDKLKKEHKELKEKTIPEIAARIDEAKQLGDLSENAEYHAAKEDMAFAQGRLAEFELKLRDAEIIVQSGRTDTVEIGSTITIESDGVQKTYTIVGPPEADPAAGLISNETPLGIAFLGKRVGERVEVQTPAGHRVYSIVSIS